MNEAYDDLIDARNEITKLESRVADLERECERLKEQLQAVEDRADKNFESYARIKDKYSIEANSNKQLTERCMVLEGDVESWHLQFSIADADLDLTKEKVGKMEIEIQQQQQTIERLEGALREISTGPHSRDMDHYVTKWQKLATDALTHKTGGEKRLQLVDEKDICPQCDAWPGERHLPECNSNPHGDEQP